LPLLALAIAGGLAGCGNSYQSASQSTDSAETGDPVHRFITCLTNAGVEAQTPTIREGNMLLTPDMVYIRTPFIGDPTAPGREGYVARGGISGFSDPVAPGSSPFASGYTWIAVDSGADLWEVPEIMAAYQSCEAAVPEFSQPQPMGPGNPIFDAQVQADTEDAMEFAQCARSEGFTDFADPGGVVTVTPEITVPETITSAMLRLVLDACWQDTYTFQWNIGQPGSPIYEEKLAVLREFWN